MQLWFSKSLDLIERIEKIRMDYMSRESGRIVYSDKSPGPKYSRLFFFRMKFSEIYISSKKIQSRLFVF